MNVVDASVALKWVYDEPGSAQARTLLASEPGLTAPAFWVIEATNALSRKAREGHLTREDVEERSAYLRAVPVLGVDDRLLLNDGLTLALQLHHPLYDCIYLALAVRERSMLITADEEFAKAAARGGYSPLIALIGPAQP